MALSGNFSTNKYSGDIGLKLSWTGTQSITNNTTTIKWTLQSDGGSTGDWWYAAPITVVINGKTVLSVSSRFKLYGGGKYKKTGSITVAHNGDGTKNVAMSIKAAIYSTSVNCTGSKTFTLNKINRYALITSAQDFNDEDSPTIEYSNPAGTDLVRNLKVRMTWNNGADYTSWIDLADDGSDSPYTFDLSNYIDTMLASCSDSLTLDVQVDLQSTLDGTEYHDRKDIQMYVINANPTITASALTYLDSSSTASITRNNQIIVRNKSTLTINVDPTNNKISANKYAMIGNLGTSAYNINFNGTNYTPDSSGNVVISSLDIAGEIPATLTVKDSRGLASSLTMNIMVYDWQAPTATYTLERVNGFEDETILHVNANYSSVNSINAVTIEEQYRKKGSQTWLPVTPESVSNNTDFSINSPTGLDKQYEWEVKITVTDLFYSPSVVEIVEAVGKGVPLFYPDFKRNSIGMNGFADEDNQLFIGEGGHIKADGVKFPKVWGDTEHFVGYWIDGTTPVYEQTVMLTSSKNLSANGTTNIMAWNEEIMPISFVAYRDGSSATNPFYSIWGDIGCQWQGNYLKGVNPRSDAVTIDGFTMRYIKIPQS